MSMAWKLIIVSQIQTVGYLNFEFDDLIDDIVANLHERNTIVLHRWTKN